MALVLVSALLAAIASSDTLHGSLLGLLEVVHDIIAEHPGLGAVLFILLAALSAMLAFLSSAFLVPAALLAWGETLTLVLLWVGWVLGAAAAYGAARYLGRPAIAWIMSDRALASYEERIPRDAPLGLVILFQLALPSEIPGYLLGLAGYPFRKYLIAASIGELPYAIGTVYLGATLLQRRLTLLLAIGAAGALLGLLAIYVLRRRLRTDHSTADVAESPSGPG